MSKKRKNNAAGPKCPSFQEAVAALQGLHEEARKAGADQLSIQEIEALVREVRRRRKAAQRAGS